MESREKSEEGQLRENRGILRSKRFKSAYVSEGFTKVGKKRCDATGTTPADQVRFVAWIDVKRSSLLCRRGSRFRWDDGFGVNIETECD